MTHKYFHSIPSLLKLWIRIYCFVQSREAFMVKGNKHTHAYTHNHHHYYHHHHKHHHQASNITSGDYFQKPYEVT